MRLRRDEGRKKKALELVAQVIGERKWIILWDCVNVWLKLILREVKSEMSQSIINKVACELRMNGWKSLLKIIYEIKIITRTKCVGKENKLLLLIYA